MKDIAEYIVQDDLNLELFICTEVLKLESLHFGYWENGEALNMKNVKLAQARYTDHLVGQVPEGVKKILDVGCGIGDVSRSLKKAGYEVSALSPDMNHGSFFKKGELATVPFYNMIFEDLDIDEKFDLILMSESQNYIELNKGMEQCQRYLNPGGYLLICGMFRKERNEYFNQMRNVEGEFVETLKKYDFHLEKRIDITSKVLPTMAFANNSYHEYILPFLKMVEYYIKGSSPIKQKLVKWFMRKEIERAEVIHKYYMEFFNPEIFQANVNYLTVLYTYKP